MRRALTTLLWASGGCYSDINGHTWVVLWVDPRHSGPWKDGGELIWPWAPWHHVCSVSGVRWSLGCWAQLQDGCWIWEQGGLQEPQPCRAGLGIGSHFLSLHGTSCLSLPTLRFCALIWEGLEAMLKAGRTELSGSVPCPSHKFSHTIPVP